MKRFFGTILLLHLVSTMIAQGVVSVSPVSATLGDQGVIVTLTLDAASAPPGSVMPNSVTIGPRIGKSISRNNQYVYATFDFIHMIAGTYNAVIIFPGPPPDTTKVWFTLSACFTVTDTLGLPWTIPGTNVPVCYDTVNVIPCPADSSALFFGQYNGTTPSYQDNGDGTVTDLLTGLMWQQDPGAKKTYMEARSGADTLTLGGYHDWRLPSIKELYSLIEFSGVDPSVPNGTPLSLLTPFIDTNYFVFHYGDTTAGERIIDAQYWSTSEYVGITMNRDHSVFGVNFADGRIKSYPQTMGSSDNKLFTQYVRGNTNYGINSFTNNGDSTITDHQTNLMWLVDDCGYGMNWPDALSWVQTKNVQNYLGYDDWRLPTTKELESIVDYTRSPSTTNSPAINPLFHCTSITNEAGQPDYPCYWTCTTHDNYIAAGRSGAYVAFGRAMGYMNGSWQDVHGAGAQRSDPKQGDTSDYPQGHGPQGDAIRILNYVRCVRTISYPAGINTITPGDLNLNITPNPVKDYMKISFTLLKRSDLTVECLTLTGQSVYRSDLGNLSAGNHEIILQLFAKLGVYFIRVTSDQRSVVKKVIIL